MQNPKPVFQLYHDTEDGPSASWSPDGTRILTNGENYLQLWDSSDGTKIAEVVLNGGLFTARWSRTGDQILGSCTEGTARVWDGRTGQELLRLDHTDDPVWTQAKWNQDETRILTQFGNEVAIWDAVSGQKLHSFRAQWRFYFCQWLANDTQVITTNDKRTIRLWNATSGDEIAFWETRQSYRNGFQVRVKPDESQLAVFSSNTEEIELWDLVNQHPASILSSQYPMQVTANTISDDGTFEGPDWSPDGSKLATSWHTRINWLNRPPNPSHEATVEIWDTATQQRIQILHSSHYIYHMQWSQDSLRLLCALENGDVRLINVMTGAIERQFKHEAMVESFTWLEAENLLLTYTSEGHVRVWNTATTEVLFAANYEGTINSVALHPNRKRLLVSWIGNDIDIYDVDLSR